MAADRGDPSCSDGGFGRRQPRYPNFNWAGGFASLPFDSFAND